MNPFMMMFGPMGMGFFGGCGCGINMPYYGNNDMLTFMNFPVFRNTSNDYLLDPRLALMQCQQSWMNGGSIFGNSYLPLFNNFPGVSNMPFSPWWNPTQTKTETEEEKKKREAKEAEAKKPEAKKAASLKKVFDSVKKLAENRNNRFPKIPDELVTKAEEALKKETAKEQLDAMKEVMSSIPDATLRKTILADDEVKKQLKAAGYNFKLTDGSGKRYSLDGDDIPETDITHETRMTSIRCDIVSSTYDYTEFQNLAAQLSGSNASRILEFLSAWNSKNNEKILELISNHIPDGNDAVKLSSAQECVITIAKALQAKAKEYEGYPEISRLQQELSEKISAITSAPSATNEDRKRTFTKEKLTDLSNVFNTLYARLRMQEAVRINQAIKENDDFRALNELKEGLINDDMVVEETMKDLEGEGITNYPKVNELDKEPVTEEIEVSREIEAEDADEQYKDNPQGLVDEYLDDKKGVLSKVSPESNVYQTKGYDEDGTCARYFTVKDNKLIEVKKNAEGKFVAEANPSSVTAKEIMSYDYTLTRISNLIDGGSIVPFDGHYTTTKLPFPVFKATGADEFYALIDGRFGKIDKCTGLPEDTTNKKIHVKGAEKTIDQLKAEDLVDFKDEDVKSKEKVTKNQIKEENSEVEAIEAMTFESLKDAKSYTKRMEISNLITKDENGESKDEVVFKPIDDANGCFKSEYNGKIRYYKYDEKTNKLICLTTYLNNKDRGGVISIKNGIAKIQSSKGVETVEIRENILEEPLKEGEKYEDKIQEYGLAFAKSVSGPDYSNDYPNAQRKLNTLVATIGSKKLSSDEKASFVYNFIKGYQKNCGWLTAQSRGICKQIIEESGINTGESTKEYNSKMRYIAKIAAGVIELAKVCEYDNQKDIDYLIKVSKMSAGQITLTSILAESIDDIIERIFKHLEKSEGE